MSVDTWRTINLGVVSLGQTAFVLLYFTFPWWRSFLGRALFFKALALALILDFYWWFRIHPFPNADVVFVALYGLLAIGVWVQFLAFLRVKVEGREND